MKSTKYKGGYIYETPLSKIEYIGYFYAKNGAETVKEAMPRIAKERGREPDIFMNSEYFDFITRTAASDVVSQGIPHRLTEGYGIAFVKNKIPVFSYKNNVNAPDYIGAYPVLVRNGKEEKQNPSGITGRRGRTALGLSGDSLFTILIPDKNGATLEELRKKLVAMGVENAINLDGGGSTQFYAPNGNYFSGRKVRGFIGIWFKQNENTKTEPVKTTQQDVRIVTAKKGLNVRSGAGLWFKRVGGIPYGKKVTVLKTSGTWCKIAEGQWVSSLYLKK